MLRGKRILLGVTGSIAAYKGVELLRELVKRGAEVQVVMTEAATRFVAPLTFETLSCQPVPREMFSPAYDSRIGHIEATQRADLFVVAPATAHTIARHSPPRSRRGVLAGRQGVQAVGGGSSTPCGKMGRAPWDLRLCTSRLGWRARRDCVRDGGGLFSSSARTATVAEARCTRSQGPRAIRRVCQA